MRNAFVMLVAGLVLTVASNASGQQRQPPDVRSEIRSGAVPRSYNDILQRYDVAAVPDLIEMTRSAGDMQYWAEAAGILGMIGDARAADALIALVEEPGDSEYIPREWNDARNIAMRGLGFLIHRTGNEKALKYLIESLDDTIWRRRGLRGVVSYSDNSGSYDVQMSQYAIFALATSGHPRAGEALRSLRDSPTPNQARLRDGLDDILKTWLEVYDLAAERGVAGMYEYYEQQRQIKGIAVN